MLDLELGDLDLGSRRKPTEWVAVAPPLVTRKQNGRGGTRSIDGEQRIPELALLGAENDEGNVEYKLRLKDPTPLRFQQLVTQLKYRLSEGSGECFYYVGVEDDGYPRGLPQPELDMSLATLRSMAAEVTAAIAVLRKMPGSHGRVCAVVRVHRLCVDEIFYTDLRVAVAGSIDSGKSTLVAVLTHGSGGRPLLDNGHGAARMNVLRHKHEIESGRTSSISQQLLGYDEEDKVLNYGGIAAITQAEISATACKVLRFFDLGGHEKYMKTAMYGMTCMLPDYLLLCVCACAGMSRVTCEHLAVAVALEVPIAVVVTKTDVASASAVEAVIQSLRELLAAAAAGTGVLHSETTSSLMHGAAFAPLVETEAQAAEAAVAIARSRIRRASHQPNLVVPIFALSNVDHTFKVTGVGSVVSGTVVAGAIAVGQELMLGPNEAGGFTRVAVTGIQRSQVPVKRVKAGQHATLAIQPSAPAEPACTPLAADNAVGAGQPAWAVAATQAVVASSYDDDALELAAPERTLSVPAVRLHAPGSSQRLGPRTGSAPSMVAWACSPPNSRKGAVLLDLAMQPRTVWQFEAVLVLLSGHWPPRGLLSGRWPPETADADAAPAVEASSGSDSCSGSSGDQRRSTPRALTRHKSKGMAYSHVVHCGSVRQAARIVSMQELSDADILASDWLVAGCSMASAIAAAATLMSPGHAGGGSPRAVHAEEHERHAVRPGCIAHVVLQFVHRPEWLQEGSRIIVRDRADGGTAGAGIVRALHWDLLTP
ncbi:hypothetical protein WJX72_003287 [[Myrmecia] bisecta]|uniref:Tr-type G domain-containing protein n=1 Tax=[Myrmecia] bisecta TaxID=41462 RepID=A0AAW1Q3P1_9CHLO